MPFGFGNIQTNNNPIIGATGLFAYWNAQNAVVTSGGTISKLPDLSENNIAARDLLPSTTGPVYIAQDPNFANKPSISSSVADIRLVATFDTSLTQPYTVYHVIRVETSSARMFWRQHLSLYADSAGFSIATGPGTTFQCVQDAGLSISSVSSISIGNKVTCFVYDNAGISSQFFNDSINALASSPANGSLNGRNCAGMGVGNYTTPVPHSWTELALFQGAHNSAQRIKIMKFLGDKYGIVIT